MKGYIPAVLDIEASGLGRGSYPIEVGYVLPDGEADCFFVLPQPDWTHWDKEAEKLHGIERQQLQTQGLDVVTLAHKLNTLLSGRILFSDAWGQDHSWLMRLFQAAGIWPEFKLQSIRYILDEAQLPYWHQARQQAEEELKLPRHRACSDAMLVQRSYVLSEQMLQAQQAKTEFGC